MSVKNKKGSVYVIIPTYNRVELTRKCLSLLCDQTYKNIRVIVSDGNSSDGTPHIISAEYPEVVLLRSNKTLWWGGAMAKGIEYVKENSTSQNDFVLMMNDDTDFPKDYIEKMVNASVKYSTVFGSLTANIDAPESILDVGVYINWNEFSFSTKKTRIEKKTICHDVDTLPGRGTIIPVEIVRDVGNINVKKLPHYLGDYEYFCRVKKKGYRLCVTYETKILIHPDKTGLVRNKNDNIFRRIYFCLSRRSKSNIFDQYNFIDSVAPDKLKRVLKMRFIPQKLQNIIFFMEGK